MILRRYMTRQIALNTALVVGFLTLLLLGGRMIRYFGIAAEGRLDVGLLFSIIGYNLPFFLELIVPLSFFIAFMLVFGRLYVDSEMAVLNGSGISRGRLARLTAPLIIALFVIEAGLTLFAKPWGVKNSDAIWQQQSLSSAFDLIRPQSFISSDDYHLYVGSVSDDKSELRDVILVQTADDRNNKDTDPASPLDTSGLPTQAGNNRDVIVLAKRAMQVQGGEMDSKTQLDLYQGRRYEIGADSLVYNQVSFERYRISIDNPTKEVVTEDNVESQRLAVLWQAATGQALPILADTNDEPLSPQAMTAQNRQQQILPAQAELGYRLALPWLMIIAPMLAVPLAQVRPRQGRWVRLLPAIMIFTSCALVIISLKKPISKGSISVWTYPLAIVAFMIMALYFNWASRIHHRVRFRLGNTDNDSLSSDSDSHSAFSDTKKGGQS